MLLSCKCLNFIANSGNESTSNGSLAAGLMQTFLQKYPRNFIFYSPCMDFFKQSMGPISDLTINALSQRDLIYSLTLEMSNSTAEKQSWQLSICINCHTTLCAKRLQSDTNPTQQQYLINSTLIISNEELSHRRADRSYSEAFGLLIMDHPTLKTPTTPPPTAINNFLVGSAAMNSNVINAADSKQQRLRQLQQNLQQRLKCEIDETDERIQRFTEQQFALLKSFREKSEQEYELLARLIQLVPEQQAGSGEWWLDRQPPALEVNGGAAAISFASTRRRNTISSRRELNSHSTVTTPTTTPIVNQTNVTQIFPTATIAADTSTTSNIITSAIDGNTQVLNSITDNSNISNNVLTNTTVVTPAVVTRKMSNFDTPPATPEATPMSVGNSPTFRQQQQQRPTQQQPPQSFGNGNLRLLSTQMSFQQQFPTPTAEMNDDCIFELEGVEGTNSAPPSAFNPAAAIITLQQQQYQRNNQQQQLRDSNQQYMSDLDESDADAEEAEDALDMDSSFPIPMASRYRTNNNNNMSNAQMLNYAKSLPIDIANSPMAEHNSRATTTAYNLNSEEDELDNTVDIAASIKAIAKSVHGEAVFGDLPRPRLRSQI